MLMPIPATPVKVTCTERAFPEFPDMLFGKADDGTHYIDATLYLQKHGPSSNLDEFFMKYEAIISAMKASYGIPDSGIHAINEEGHHLIDSNLIYLLIAFAEPSFWAYIFDRVHEMFSSGFCVSDTYVLGIARERLPKEVVMEAFNNGEN